MSNEVYCHACFELKPPNAMSTEGGKIICLPCRDEKKKEITKGRLSKRLIAADNFALHMIVRDARGQYVDDDFEG